MLRPRLQPMPHRLATLLTNQLSPPVRRAIRAARALYERDVGAPEPTPEALALIAQAACAPAAPVQARFGFAVESADRDTRIARMLYAIAQGETRFTLESLKHL